MQKRISPEEFVSIWNSSDSRSEAAKKMGYSPKYTAQLALKYRKEGHALKHMRRLRRNVTWEEFAELWNSATTVQEVAAVLDTTRKSVSKQAAIMRSKGYALKHMPAPYRRGKNMGRWARWHLDAGCTISRRGDKNGPAYVAINEDGEIVDWWRIE